MFTARSPVVDIRGQKISVSNAMRRNISPSSCAGAPGLVLPAGLTTAGLPVGIEFDAPAREDRRLLALGLSPERTLGPIAAPTRGKIEFAITKLWGKKANDSDRHHHQTSKA